MKGLLAALAALALAAALALPASRIPAAWAQCAAPFFSHSAACLANAILSGEDL